MLPVIKNIQSSISNFFQDNSCATCAYNVKDFPERHTKPFAPDSLCGYFGENSQRPDGYYANSSSQRKGETALFPYPLESDVRPGYICLHHSSKTIANNIMYALEPNTWLPIAKTVQSGVSKTYLKLTNPSL